MGKLSRLNIHHFLTIERYKDNNKKESEEILALIDKDERIINSEYFCILNKLIKLKKWKSVFKYLKGESYNITIDQTKRDCIEYLSENSDVDTLQFVINQDDELVLIALKSNIENLLFVRVPLNKATLVEIDLLYGKCIESCFHLKFQYNELLKNCK